MKATTVDNEVQMIKVAESGVTHFRELMCIWPNVWCHTQEHSNMLLSIFRQTTQSSR